MAVVDPIAEIEHARALALAPPPGWAGMRRKAVAVEPAPGLAAEEIEQVEAGVGVPLPPSLWRLLEYTGGINGLLDQIDFSGRSLEYEAQEIFPSGLPLAGDGIGNFWVLDLTPGESDATPVFFACHDPPVVLYQSAGIGEFLHELVLLFEPPHESLVDAVHEDRLFGVWRQNPDEIGRAAALAGDESLRAFAASLDDHFQFVDLRAPAVGAGFSWARHGPRTDVRRHGYERLFAYAPPPPRPRLLERLLGRRRA
jgi:cell wall assembly regulator SMI1